MNKLIVFVFKLGKLFPIYTDYSVDNHKEICKQENKPFNMADYRKIKNTKLEQIVLFSDTITNDLVFFSDYSPTLISNQVINYDTSEDLEKAKDKYCNENVKTVVDEYVPKFKYNISSDAFKNPRKSYSIEVTLDTDYESYHRTLSFNIDDEEYLADQVIKFEATALFLKEYLTARCDCSDIEEAFGLTELYKNLMIKYSKDNNIDKKCLMHNEEYGHLDITGYNLIYTDEVGKQYVLTLS